jgi:hypothetical protein
MGGRKSGAIRLAMKEKKPHRYRPVGNVKFRGKTYQLFKRSDSDTSPLSFRFQHQGKRRMFTTDTADLPLAKARAKQMLESLLDGNWNDRMQVQTPRGIPTIGEVLDWHDRADRVVRENTARNYQRSLLVILRQVNGWTDEQAKAAKVDVLTEALVRRWQAIRQERESVNFVDPLECNTSINSTLRQARSVFSRRMVAEMEAAGIVMPPTLVGFLKARNVKEVTHRFVPIPQATVDAMNAALPALREEDERLWAFHLMIRMMGLRSSEILRARRHWLVEAAGQTFLAVDRRHGEQAPKRGDGMVPVPQILLDWFSAHGDEKLIPGASEHDREAVKRRHSKWVRQFLPNRTKTNHELRKHTGSVIAMKYNSFERAAEFLRIDLDTAREYYLAFIRPIPPMDLTDL